MSETPEAKRLTIVFKDYGRTTRSFAQLLEVSQSSIIRMMKGTQPITQDVTRAVCYKLGYAAEWFIMGTGNKKKAKDEVKMVTEIKLLRVDYEMVLNKNRALEARMMAYEQELENLKKLISGK
jgi:plasmid maintenance system antidote protein VapI